MSRHVTLTDGNPKTMTDLRSHGSITVGITPGSGCTVACEVSLGNDNRWYPWDAGPVTAPTIRVINGSVRAIRFTRTAGSDATSIGEIL